MVAIFASECSMCSQYPTLVFRKKWSNNRNSSYYRRDKLETQILSRRLLVLFYFTFYFTLPHHRTSDRSALCHVGVLFRLTGNRVLNMNLFSYDYSIAFLTRSLLLFSTFPTSRGLMKVLKLLKLKRSSVSI